MTTLDNFTRHYLVAALWSSTDDDGEPLDAQYDISDIAPQFLEKAISDCTKFQAMHAGLLARAYEYYDDSGMSYHPDAGSPQACAGHDFWLTRCGHGVGFWDRGMGKIGDVLTRMAHEFGNIDLYVGDDGRIHGA